MKTSNLGKLIVAIVVCELAGVIGSVFTISAIPNWYALLNKPNLAPPNYVFGPVWVTLFFLMGITLFLVWKKGYERKDVKIAFGTFGIQLALNVIWSIIFFGTHSPGIALIAIFFLWLTILETIISFYKISKSAAYLLLPYIGWVTFAAYLNFMIWKLN